MRKFETFPEEKKVYSLLMAFSLAISEPEYQKKARTADIYTTAAFEYGRVSELRPEDFELIKNKTVAELAELTKLKP